MKTIFTLILSFLLGTAAFSQYGYNTVTVTLNGNKNQQILIDGRTYTATNNGSYQQQGKYKKPKKGRYDDDRNNRYDNNGPIVINNLSTGQHTLQLISTYNQNGSRGNSQPVAFTLRPGFDLDIKVDGSGRISMKEKRVNGRGNAAYNNGGYNNGYGSTYRTPMPDASFNALYQDIQRKWMPGQKMTALRNAFSTQGNYFNTYQVRQLVQLTNGESNRLELLKSSFSKITDSGNFTQLYDLLSTQASRDELDYYIRQYR